MLWGMDKVAWLLHIYMDEQCSSFDGDGGLDARVGLST